MQTFLPYPSFAKSARCLDNRRLNKQITEVWQIYRTLTGQTEGWRNHPAVKMWAGYEWALLEYGLNCYSEWRWRHTQGWRGGKLSHKAGQEITLAHACQRYREQRPDWLGLPTFHAAHRAVLLAKDGEWYGQFNWPEAAAEQVDGRWPYVWP